MFTTTIGKNNISVGAQNILWSGLVISTNGSPQQVEDIYSTSFRRTLKLTSPQDPILRTLMIINVHHVFDLSANLTQILFFAKWKPQAIWRPCPRTLASKCRRMRNGQVRRPEGLQFFRLFRHGLIGKTISCFVDEIHICWFALRHQILKKCSSQLTPQNKAKRTFNLLG